MTDAKDTRRTGAPGESTYGFAQAVRVGNTVYVSGQTASSEGGTVGVGDMRAQMAEAYRKIADLLASYGATMANVVDETLFVTDMRAAIPAAIEVRREVYGPAFDVASTLVEVRALAGPDLLVEIKCVATL
ncbi:MAG TPA: RidA family protein [Acidimicrobiales bacterium]